MDDTRPFPIQDGPSYRNLEGRLVYPQQSKIPWWLAEEAYIYYSAKYGKGQSLERLAERGGFGREELLLYLRREKP
ncbi:MAG TPA: hypothetical protein ENI23_11740 [bacterium]|nr:hypothetical protein [bacterium]